MAPVGLPAWPLSLHPHYRAAPAAAADREVRNGLTVHRPRYRVWPKLGAAGAARRMADALLPVLRDAQAGLSLRRDRRRILLAGRAGGGAAGAALGVPFSIKARGSDIHIWGAAPGIGEQIVAAGQAADGMLAVSRRDPRRHGGARHAGGEDPRPLYRHRSRHLPARRPRRGQGRARRHRTAARHGGRPARAQGPGSRDRGTEALSQAPP